MPPRANDTPLGAKMAAALWADSSLDTLVDRLHAEGAFDGYPAAHFVLRHIVDSGLGAQVADPATDAASLAKAVDRFTANTGFRPVIVDALVDALAEALRRRDLVGALAGDSEMLAAEPDARYGSAMASADNDFDLLPPERKTDILGRRLKVDSSLEPYRGVTLVNPAVTDVRSLPVPGLSEVTVTATLKRTSPLGSAQVRYAIYDALGVVVSEGVAATMVASGHPVNPFTLRIRCCASSVGRILLMVE